MSAEQQIPPRKGDLSRVTVTINGRRFRMACEQGQEAHVRRLAGDLDQRIGRLVTVLVVQRQRAFLVIGQRVAVVPNTIAVLFLPSHFSLLL